MVFNQRFSKNKDEKKERNNFSFGLSNVRIYIIHIKTIVIHTKITFVAFFTAVSCKVRFSACKSSHRQNKIKIFLLE